LSRIGICPGTDLSIASKVHEVMHRQSGREQLAKFFHPSWVPALLIDQLAII
jgi:hypothetical protein